MVEGEGSSSGAVVDYSEEVEVAVAPAAPVAVQAEAAPPVQTVSVGLRPPVQAVATEGVTSNPQATELMQFRSPLMTLFRLTALQIMEAMFNPVPAAAPGLRVAVHPD